MTGQHLGCAGWAQHLALRLQFDGTTITHNDAEKLNLWALPVGVTFSSNIEAGAWQVKPQLDLTVTANLGDDEIDTSATFVDLYGRVPPLSKQPPKTALCAVPAITLKLFVVIIRAINRQKARYLWLFASKWQSTVQVDFCGR